MIEREGDGEMESHRWRDRDGESDTYRDGEIEMELEKGESCAGYVGLTMELSAYALSATKPYIRRYQ